MKTQKTQFNKSNIKNIKNNQYHQTQLLPKSVCNYRGYLTLQKFKMINSNDIDTRNVTAKTFLNNKKSSQLKNKLLSKQNINPFINDQNYNIQNISKFNSQDTQQQYLQNAQIKQANLKKDNTLFNQSQQNRFSKHNNLIETQYQKFMNKMQKKINLLMKTQNQKQQWKHYIIKTNLLKLKNKSYQPFEQIQNYLLKVIYKYITKKNNQFRIKQSRTIEEQQKNNLKSIINSENNDFNKSLYSNFRKHQTSFNQDSTINNILNFDRQTQLCWQTNKFKNSQIQPMIKQDFNQSDNNIKGSNLQSFCKGKKQKKINDQYVINSLNLQISVLQKKIQILEQTIADLNNPNQAIQDQNGQNDNKMTLQNLKILNQKKKYQNQAQLRKIQYDTLNRQFNALGKINQSLKNQLEQMNKQIKQMKVFKQKLQAMSRYRQLWMMLNQQFLSLNQKCQKLIQEKNGCLKKIINLKQKNRQLIKNFHMSNQMNTNLQDDQKYDLDNIMKNFKDWLKVFSVPRVNDQIKQGQKTILNHQKSLTLDKKENQNKDQEKNKKSVQFEDPKKNNKSQQSQQDQLNYRLLRPNFFIFFEAYESSIISEKVFAQHRTLQPLFYAKLRSILDSMYNHFLFYNHQKWSSFPEFVVGFMQKFCINPIKRIPQLRKNPIQSQQKVNFLIDLFNRNVSNTFQCQIFRSFILQQYYLDEIFFYLDCRNQLNFGSVLIHKGLGSADPIIYVRLNHAIQVIQSRLIKYDSAIVEKIKGMIVSKKKFKNGVNLVDTNFVLKILLQVYSLEKVKSQKIFQQSFAPRIRNEKVSFIDYHAFMIKNFKFMTSLQIAKIYRQIYTLSSGNITYKAVHFMCGIKGLFIPLLMNNKPNGACDSRSLGDDMLYMDIQNQMCKIVNGVQQTGLQELTSCQINLNQFLRDTQWQRANKSIFYKNLLNQLLPIFKSKFYLQWSASCLNRNTPISRDTVKQFMKKMKFYLKESQQAIGLLNKQKQRKNICMKMITRNFKIRVQQTLQEFNLDHMSIPQIAKQAMKRNKINKDLQKKQQNIKQI